jgi:hypothetical protein
MKSTHNTIRALALGLGLTLLVVTGTAAMMAAFASSPPATDIYRRFATTTVPEAAPLMATAHDSVLYERVVLADGRVQWVLIEEPGTTLAKSSEALPAVATHTPSETVSASSFSYVLAVKPAGLSKAVTDCRHSAYGVYDIACNAMI